MKTKTSLVLLLFFLSLIPTYAQRLIAGIEKKGKAGFISNRDEIICGPVLEESISKRFFNNTAKIEHLKEGYGYLTVDGKMKILSKGTDGLQRKIVNLKPFNHGFAAIAPKQGKWGYVNSQLEVVIQPQYLSQKDFVNGRAWVKIRASEWVAIDTTGKIVIQNGYTACNNFKNGYAKVRRDGKWGFVNRQGEEIGGGINYHDISDEIKFGKFFAIYRDKGKYSIADVDGSIFYKKQFIFIDKFDDNGFTIVRDSDGVHLLDAKTMIFLDLPIYKRIKRGIKTANYITYNQDGTHSVIDETGALIGKKVFSFVSSVDIQAPYTVKHEGKLAYLKPDGTLICKGQYDELMPFHVDRAAVRVKGRWGYVDLDGNLVIPPKFKIANPFISDWAVVLEDNRYGYIDKSGVYRIQPQFLEARPFSEDLKLNLKHTTGVNFRDNRERASTRYTSKLANTEYAKSLTNLSGYVSDEEFQNHLKNGAIITDYTIVKTKDTWTIIDRKGNIKTPKIGAIGKFMHGHVRFHHHGWGFLNSDGKVVVKPVWDHVEFMTLITEPKLY